MSELTREERRSRRRERRGRNRWNQLAYNPGYNQYPMYPNSTQFNYNQGYNQYPTYPNSTQFNYNQGYNQYPTYPIPTQFNYNQQPMYPVQTCGCVTSDRPFWLQSTIKGGVNNGQPCTPGEDRCFCYDTCNPGINQGNGWNCSSEGAGGQGVPNHSTCNMIQGLRRK
jgi:hypothetical protein